MKSFLISATLFATALAAPRPPKWNSFDSKTRVAPRPKASFHMDPSYQMMAAATADNITTGAGQITAPFENIWACELCLCDGFRDTTDKKNSAVER